MLLFWAVLAVTLMVGISAIVVKQKELFWVKNLARPLTSSHAGEWSAAGVCKAKHDVPAPLLTGAGLAEGRARKPSCDGLSYPAGVRLAPASKAGRGLRSEQGSSPQHDWHLGRIIHCMGRRGLSWDSRMVSSILALYPRDTGSNALLPSCDIVSRHCRMSSEGQMAPNWEPMGQKIRKYWNKDRTLADEWPLFLGIWKLSVTEGILRNI